MVRAHELLAGELVEARGEPLRGAARVAEHDRGAVGEDQLEHAWVHVRPDALVGLGRVEAERVGGGARRPRVRAGLGHVVDGNDHLDVELFARAGVDDRHGARHRLGLAAEEARDLVERALRGREADALRRCVGDRVEALEREREVRAALGRRERVDLVDDHCLDAAEYLARLRREHQVERLGRGDEDVGRGARDVLAFLRRRVAGAHRDRGRGERRAEPLGGERDAGERCAQVLLDVDGERAQRRDVEDPAALALGRTGARPRRSMAERNAASVLPEPVGASSRVWSPAPIAGQPCSCAPVGAAKLVSNHARVGAEKRSSTLTATAPNGTAGLRHRSPGSAPSGALPRLGAPVCDRCHDVCFQRFQ